MRLTLWVLVLWKIPFCIFLQCEPISGLGFRRGSYRCVCIKGFYFPGDHFDQHHHPHWHQHPHNIIYTYIYISWLWSQLFSSDVDASTKYYNGTILEEEYEKKLEVTFHFLQIQIITIRDDIEKCYFYEILFLWQLGQVHLECWTHLWNRVIRMTRVCTLSRVFRSGWPGWTGWPGWPEGNFSVGNVWLKKLVGTFLWESNRLLEREENNVRAVAYVLR